MTTHAEIEPIRADAWAQLEQLYVLEAELRCDLDDMFVLSEWANVRSRIRMAEQALHAEVAA